MYPLEIYDTAYLRFECECSTTFLEEPGLFHSCESVWAWKEWWGLSRRGKEEEQIEVDEEEALEESDGEGQFEEALETLDHLPELLRPFLRG